jgi:hypothetical protein
MPRAGDLLNVSMMSSLLERMSAPYRFTPESLLPRLVRASMSWWDFNMSVPCSCPAERPPALEPGGVPGEPALFFLDDDPPMYYMCRGSCGKY